MSDKCLKCGAEKQEGFPCVACWDREIDEELGPKVCGVSAPCGNPCSAVPTTGADVVGHYDFHPAPGGYGWICPKCGKVYGPNTMECWGCNQLYKVTTGQYTGSANSPRY